MSATLVKPASSKSLRVRASMPFAASITMTTPSAAISARAYDSRKPTYELDAATDVGPVIDEDALKMLVDHAARMDKE